MKIPEISRKPLLLTLLLFFINTLTSPVLAQYDVNNTGVSDVNGLTGGDVQPANGENFGSVVAIADTNNAYALFGDGGNIQISGDVPVGGIIQAQAGNNGAYGLYTNGSGTIQTQAINGTISATAVNESAYGLFANSSITIGDVNGTISSHANSYAYGLRSYDSSIATGDINGAITALADANSAYGMSAGTTINTDNINGSITATAVNDSAYGLFANNSITIGDVNGTISSNAKSNAYGLRTLSDWISVGVIRGNISSTATTESAYGLFANSYINIIDVNGTIETTGNTNAIGLRSVTDSIATNAISGTISTTGTNGYAYGLYANNSISTGDVNGTIETTAYSDAYSLRTSAGSILTGVIDGTISAIADTNSAYGFYSNTTIDTGNINGAISASAGNNDAYGLFANGNITIGDVNGTIESSANLNAYGLRSYTGLIDTGAIIDDINSTSSTDYAYGLSAYTSIETDDINGVIRATAGNDYAYGLSTFSGSISTGAISGTILADANNSSAYGINTNNGSISTGDITGAILATADSDTAYALNAGNAITIGDVNGYINAMTGTNSAYGLKSSNGPINVGNIGVDGEIYALARTDGGYGIFSSDNDITIGNIEGTVYGRSDANDAFGLYSYSDSVTTGEITGNVWGYAVGEYAYGILSYGEMDITINGGFIAGRADENSATGVAIQSGRLDSHVLTTQDANDSVEIVAGSRILGDIDLGMSGTDNDVLTLSGVDTKRTTLDNNLKNIETINLTGGTWYLNGTVSDTENGITMTGGVLGGTGTLGSLNVTGGTVAPGNSIGTTTIDGDFTIDTGATLEIEIDNSGNSDKLVVSGDATINGGTVKAISTETIGTTHEYTIIEANNVSGQFDVLDTALIETILSQFTADMNYSSDSVILTVVPERFNNTDFLITANQLSLGSALQQIADSGGNAITTALQSLATDQEVRDAYDQLSGQTRTSLALVASTNNNRFKDTVSYRLHNTKSVFAYESSNSPLFVMEQPDEKMSVYDTDRNLNSFAIGSGTQYFASEQWGLWLRGYGAFGERDAETGSPGYNHRAYGTGFGMDYKVRDDLMFGITSGYSNGNVNYSSSRDTSDISSIPVGIYGSWFTKYGYVDSIISYASMNYETERYVDLTSETLEGEFDGFETSAYFETGRNLFWGKNTLIQPMASMQISYLNMDSYSETGGASALTFDEQSFKSYKGSLGMKIKTHLGKNPEEQNLTLELRGKWLHEFGDTETNIHANFIDSPSAIFKVGDKGLSRDSTVFGIGLRQIDKQNVMYYIDYDTSLNQKDISHVISAGLRYRW